ncbi:MAG: ferrochelatase, partial [Flavobacteriaceae bacterium]
EEIFHEVGGDNFTTIPCLNTNDKWVNVLVQWINNWATSKSPF